MRRGAASPSSLSAAASATQPTPTISPRLPTTALMPGGDARGAVGGGGGGPPGRRRGRGPPKAEAAATALWNRLLYVNAHATSTPLGELHALRSLCRGRRAASVRFSSRRLNERDVCQCTAFISWPRRARPLAVSGNTQGVRSIVHGFFEATAA